MIRCTKDDEFQVALCQCDKCVEGRVDIDSHYGAGNPMIVTDEDMVEDKVRTWKGFVFNCPNCGEDAIMPPGRGCMNCLAPIIIQSHEVTALIKGAGGIGDK